MQYKKNTTKLIKSKVYIYIKNKRYYKILIQTTIVYNEKLKNKTQNNTGKY